MEKIDFNQEQKTAIVGQIQLHFREELDQELGRFDAEFLLDFLSEQVGVCYYNQDPQDAIAIMERQVDTIKDAIYENERPTPFNR